MEKRLGYFTYFNCNLVFILWLRGGILEAKLTASSNSQVPVLHAILEKKNGEKIGGGYLPHTCRELGRR